VRSEEKEENHGERRNFSTAWGAVRGHCWAACVLSKSAERRAKESDSSASCTYGHREQPEQRRAGQEAADLSERETSKQKSQQLHLLLLPSQKVVRREQAPPRRRQRLTGAVAEAKGCRGGPQCRRIARESCTKAVWRNGDASSRACGTEYRDPRLEEASEHARRSRRWAREARWTSTSYRRRSKAKKNPRIVDGRLPAADEQHPSPQRLPSP